VPERSAQDPDNDGSEPPVHYGDRILVLKYLYLFQEPERWDVVVFKAPSDRGSGDASQLRYSSNYIKRLVGRPGESVMILDGDIYIGKPGEELEKYQVQRKPKHVQDSLWRVVYDNDFVPRGLPRDGESWLQPWTRTEGSGWELGSGQAQRAFKFDNRYESGTLEFDPGKIPGTNGLTDWLAYDEVQEDLPRNVSGYDGRRVKPAVSDLKLSLYYQRRGGDGPLSLHLSRGPDVFTADLVPGKAILTRHTTGKAPEVLAEVPVSDLAGNSPVQVEFTNVDYRVSLYVNGKRVLQTTDQQYHATEQVVHGLLDSKNTRQPRPSVRISAANQQCSVEHLSLWRDIYYLNGYPDHTMQPRSAMWGTPDKVIDLGPDDYFVLGDNSLISGDARMWDEDVDLPAERLYVQSGRVPRRFMLGKAFFVYWPAGYRPFGTRFGVVPNFGDMRFIH
jgi:signal peptidase I